MWQPGLVMAALLGLGGILGERSADAAERLRFRASWNGVPVARAELLIAPAGGSAASKVSVVARAETNEALDLVWRMRDSLEATIDPAAPRPEHFVLRQNENGKRRTSTITRDVSGRRLIGESRKRSRPPRTTVVDLDALTHDPASVGYALRLATAPVTYRVFNGRKTYELTATPMGQETVSVAGREWRARKLALALRPAPVEDAVAPPDAKPLGVQRADLWISADEARLPLRLQATTFWGWVVVELVGRGGPPLAAE